MITKLQACFRRLWAEQDGFILSSEMVLTGSLLLGGAVAGLTQVRDVMTQEFGDVAQAIGNLDQSYSVSGIRGHSAWTAGSAFYDRADVGDGVLPPGPPQGFVPGNRFVPPVARPTVCADVFPSAPPAFGPPKGPPHAPPQFAPPKKPNPAPAVKQPSKEPAPPKKSDKSVPDPKAGAAWPHKPAPGGHPHGHGMVGVATSPGCTAPGCAACLANYGRFPGGYWFGPNTNYSFPSMMRSNPYGVQQWGGYHGMMSTVIDFQPAGFPGASGAPGWGGVTGNVACQHAPCFHGHGCTTCVPSCGSIPVWGPREGSLPQQRITFTPAPQPGEEPKVKRDDVKRPSKPEEKEPRKKPSKEES